MSDIDSTTEVTISESIFQMVCDNLHITYTLDDSAKRRIVNETNDGILYLQKYGDSSATCEPGTPFARLLVEYVLRAESGALSTFAVDYAEDILQAKAEKEANDFAKVMGYAES